MKQTFLFPTELQSTYATEQYNRAQLAYLAESHKREWLERINAKICETHHSGLVSLRDMYMSLRSLVNQSQAI